MHSSVGMLCNLCLRLQQQNVFNTKMNDYHQSTFYQQYIVKCVNIIPLYTQITIIMYITWKNTKAGCALKQYSILIVCVI